MEAIGDPASVELGIPFNGPIGGFVDAKLPDWAWNFSWKAQTEQVDATATNTRDEAGLEGPKRMATIALSLLNLDVALRPTVEEALPHLEALLELESTGKNSPVQMPKISPPNKVKGDKRSIRPSASTESLALMEGLLRKRSNGTFKRWQKRYFRAAGHYLSYGDDQASACNSPKAAIDLHALQEVKLQEGTLILILEFQDGMMLELQAASEKAATDWLEALQQHEITAKARRRAEKVALLEHYAPRKATLVFSRSDEVKLKDAAAAAAAATAAAPAQAEAERQPRSDEL
jgi:hypothetical protein